MKRTRSALLAIVAIGILGACAASRPVEGVTEQQAAANRAQPYTDGLKALQTYQTIGECATAAATEVEAMIDELTTMTSQFHTVGSHIKAPACTLGDHR